MVEKVKLAGRPEKSVTWIWRDPASGQLKVEYYDFSVRAQKIFGNDIAWTITVKDMESFLYIFNTKRGNLDSLDGALLQELFWHQTVARRT